MDVLERAEEEGKLEVEEDDDEEEDECPKEVVEVACPVGVVDVAWLPI